jgi:hypothetical protein
MEPGRGSPTPSARLNGRRHARDNLLTGAERAGISLLDELSGPETTTVWQSLVSELGFARDVSTGSYTTVGFHLERPDPDTWGFHTKLEPGPFTDLIASASVMAQLRLLQHAADFFGWTIETEKVDDLLARASEINTQATRAVEDRARNSRVGKSPRLDGDSGLANDLRVVTARSRAH